MSNWNGDDWYRVAMYTYAPAVLFGMVGWWVACITVTIGMIVMMGLSIYADVREVGSSPKAKEIEPLHDPEFGIFNGYACPNWLTNRIERELGGTDILPCANLECPACFPHGKCAVGDCSEPATDKFYDGYRANFKTEWLCNSHFTIREDERMAWEEQRKAIEEAKEKRIAEVEAQRRIDQAKKEEADRKARITDVQGTLVVRPADVPAFAAGKWYRREHRTEPTNYVVWQWLDPETGNRMWLKSSHPEVWDMQATWVSKDEPVNPKVGDEWVILGDDIEIDHNLDSAVIRKAPRIQTTKEHRNAVNEKTLEAVYKRTVARQQKIDSGKTLDATDLKAIRRDQEILERLGFS